MEEFELQLEQISNNNERRLNEENIISKCKMEAISWAIIKIGIKKRRDEPNENYDEFYIFYEDFISHEYFSFFNSSYDFLDKLHNSCNNQRAKLIEVLGINKFELSFSLQNNNDNNDNNNDNNNINNNPNFSIKLDYKKGYFIFIYIIRNILSISKIIRIILQIGDIYFCLILLGIFLETSTILITSSRKFMFGWAYILEFFLLAYIFYFLNCLLILPLALQFWETSKLRYIKEINPFILILRLKKDDNINKENKCCEINLDIVCFVLIILYLLSFGLYNICPEFFEILNIICFIILPLIKFFIIFASTWYFGFRILLNEYCSCCDCSLQDNEIKTLLSFDKFERQNLNHEPSELYQDLEPVRLLMYNENKDKGFLSFK